MYENVKPLKLNVISDIHFYARKMGCEGKAFDKANASASNELYYSKEILTSLMDQLAEAGVVGEEQGTKPREILMSQEQFEQYIEEYL